jgi:hypothetical protein
MNIAFNEHKFNKTHLGYVIYTIIYYCSYLICRLEKQKNRNN